MFNFKKALEAGRQDTENRKVSLFLLAPSGGGKSFAQGSWGVKTAYLYFSQGERHGPKNAKQGAVKAGFDPENVVPICLDRIDGEDLGAEQTYEGLVTCLQDTEAFRSAGIQAIAIDSATEIEAVIRETSAYKGAISENKFNAGFATLSMFRPIIKSLQTLQAKLGVHYCLTCLLNVKELGEFSEISSAQPSLWGYQVATGLCKQFDDVLVVGKLTHGEGMKKKDKHVFQLKANVWKDTKNKENSLVHKHTNFDIRVTGVDLGGHFYIEPNLSRIVKAKEVGVVNVEEGK